MTVIDVTAMRPDAQQIVLVAGLLAEVGDADPADLSADLRLPVATVAAALRALQRSGRAQLVNDTTWRHIDSGIAPARRSWRIGGTSLS